MATKPDRSSFGRYADCILMAKVHQETRNGSSVNEDLVWTDDGAVIVLDGATGLTDRTFSDRKSDGRWYVDTLTEEIIAPSRS